MKITQRNSLRRGGFAGLRETRLVMNPRVFSGQEESGTSAGIGSFVYLADASFLPHGETRLHSHKEIDVISVMVKGRILHEGSMEHGEELQVDTVQVQRAGGDGFSHNEINPDNFKNRMIQLWVLPETAGEPAAYHRYQSEPDKRIRVYGGPADQHETFASRTIIEVAQVSKNDKLVQPGRCLVYMTEGAGKNNEQIITEGDMVETSNFNFIATQNCKMIVVYEN